MNKCKTLCKLSNSKHNHNKMVKVHCILHMKKRSCKRIYQDKESRVTPVEGMSDRRATLPSQESPARIEVKEKPPAPMQLQSRLTMTSRNVRLLRQLEYSISPSQLSMTITTKTKLKEVSLRIGKFLRLLATKREMRLTCLCIWYRHRVPAS